MRFLAKLLSISALVAITSVAKADTIDDFTLVANGHTASWFLPSNPTPDFSTPRFFVIDNVPVIYDGVSEVADYIEFSTGDPVLMGEGGVAVVLTPDTELVSIGPQLYTGPTSSPTFLIGKFDLNEGGTITITPEPSTFILLGSGFIGLVETARRRYLRP